MSQDLHHILLGCGYRYTPACRLPPKALLYSRDAKIGYYVKDYTTKQGVFSIALVLMDDIHLALPLGYVLAYPDIYSGRLIPHITSYKFLCYVEEMEADWDPNDLKKLYYEVDFQIQKTLDNIVISMDSGAPSDNEMEGEFTQYWSPSTQLYLLQEASRKTKLVTWRYEATRLGGKIGIEFVTITNDDQTDLLSRWLTHSKCADQSNKISIPTHYVSVKPNRLAGVTWPPKSLGDTLRWLSDIDHNARNKVVENILASGKKRQIILLNIRNQGLLAVYVEINNNAIAPQRHKSKGSKKPNLQHQISLLCSKQVSSKFIRLNAINADRSTLLSRNASRPGVGDLSNKRIALVGCGTIGGYLAGLLLRSGAGCGNNYLHLFDGDSFAPHNFGRHALTANEFGHSKAKALAENLMASVHIAKNIEGFYKDFPIEESTLSLYDIIIDATGRPPVSKRLALTVRAISKEKRPIVIHAFNDGNGRASKVLVDNGEHCYGCMVSNPQTHRAGIDLRFELIDINKEKHISCGSTFTPYDAAVSHITAALAQEAALNTLEPEMPWTYNEHMFDGSRSRKPSSPKQQQKCRICHAY